MCGFIACVVNDAVWLCVLNVWFSCFVFVCVFLGGDGVGVGLVWFVCALLVCVCCCVFVVVLRLVAACFSFDLRCWCAALLLVL